MWQKSPTLDSQGQIAFLFQFSSSFPQHILTEPFPGLCPLLGQRPSHDRAAQWLGEDPSVISRDSELVTGPGVPPLLLTEACSLVHLF